MATYRDGGGDTKVFLELIDNSLQKDVEVLLCGLMDRI